MTPPARAAGAPGRLTIQHLGHVSLFVCDLDATRRFYRDVLGLTETGTGKQFLLRRRPTPRPLL